MLPYASQSKFTRKAQNALNHTQRIAGELGHTYIGSEHLLLGLLSTEGSVAAKLLMSHGMTIEKIRNAIAEISGIGVSGIVRASDMTPKLRHVLEEAAHISTEYNRRWIGTEHILSAIVNEKDCVATRILEMAGLPAYELKNELVGFMTLPNASNGGGTEEESKKERSIGGCPALSDYGRDLTAMATQNRLDPIIGREKETERMIQILSRRSKNNPCLIGEPGVGKTAVVEGLARRIALGEIPETLRHKKIIMLDISSMIAGAKYRGEFEERMKNVMRECTANADIILFIDEFHTVIGAGAAEGAVDAANIIKPALARGELQMIGATTIAEYRKYVEKDAALERRFQSVLVEEPNFEETLRILKGIQKKYEEHHHLAFSEEALQAAVRLSARYISDRFLPDKAIDLMDEAASRLRVDACTLPPKLKEAEKELFRLHAEKEKAILAQKFEQAGEIRDAENLQREKYEAQKLRWEKRSHGSSLTVTAEDIAAVVTQWTGIPVRRLLEGEGEKLLYLADRLSQKVIGQQEAAEKVAAAIRRGRVGISDPSRPIGSFIFLGSTGVGKTEMTKALSEELFGSPDAVIRFDMSEYMEKHSVSKLIGSPPGYVGYDEGGQLTERVRRKPYSVVLFDEIEKASPEIFNVMLQILDEGVLTDARGRRTDFRNTVVIMTSNVGVSCATESGQIGFSEMKDAEGRQKQEKEKMKEKLRATFRPEFLNRVDEIIIFNRLSAENVSRIAEQMFLGLRQRMGRLGIRLEAEPQVLSEVARIGYDERNGARPLRRAMLHTIEDPLANEITAGKLQRGDSVKLLWDYEGGRIIITKISENEKEKPGIG